MVCRGRERKAHLQAQERSEVNTGRKTTNLIIISTSSRCRIRKKPRGPLTIPATGAPSLLGPEPHAPMAYVGEVVIYEKNLTKN